jgi:hypothetical protein
VQPKPFHIPAFFDLVSFMLPEPSAAPQPV